jgi:glycosyltransferase involved in cell wall biosynthesis
MHDRLTLVTSSFPIRGDGSEAAGAFVADLVEEIAKYVSVDVVAPGKVAGIESWADRVQIYRYAAPVKPLSTLRPWSLQDLSWILRVLRGGRRSTYHAVANGSRHVLALWGLPCGAWAQSVSKELNVEYSVWLLGSDVWALGRVPMLRSRLRSVIRNAKQAYADGFRLCEDAEGIAGAQVRFLPSTRNVEQLPFIAPRSKGPYRFLFLGRWHRNKGIDIFLDALELLEENDWANITSIEIQGGGPLEPLVHGRVSVLRSAGRPVELGCFLVKSEAVAAIVRADWVLIPSRIESIPVVFSDAMKLGRPVIAMPVGDLPRLMSEDSCGVLAADVSAQAFASAMQKALCSSPASFSSGIRTRAELFDISKIVSNIRKDVFGER